MLSLLIKSFSGWKTIRIKRKLPAWPAGGCETDPDRSFWCVKKEKKAGGDSNK
jgi:hypothetical protein